MSGYRNLGQDRSRGEEDAAVGAADLLFDLAGSELEVDEGGGGAGEDGGVVGDDPVDAVLGADGDAVALAQTDRDEAGGGVFGQRGELGPGDAAVAVDVGEAVGEVRGGECRGRRGW